MFTGIIESVGVVRSVRGDSNARTLCVDLGLLSEGTRPGDSIAVGGVCLTVSKLAGTMAEFDVSGQTLAQSTIGRWSAGTRVNLERALRADGRFGGHIVQGHVDGLAKMIHIEKKGDFWEMIFRVSNELLSGMIPKGSVAIDGISLTVARMDDRSFTVALIPTTVRETTLAQVRAGDIVNIETDILVRTIQAQLKHILGDKQGLTVEKLKEYGF
ncbi:MAG: riboflavin synthase [Sedimentisphaerales bacterium]|nr:riboflavin synthase [Sedimentisphaerales bacterium]